MSNYPADVMQLRPLLVLDFISIIRQRMKLGGMLVLQPLPNVSVSPCHDTIVGEYVGVVFIHDHISVSF
jgi:hypothetical protein